ncbi:MAG: c-type cytochrome biogenesis protein CcsB [Syntrophotaleaceae bacterium]
MSSAQLFNLATAAYFGAMVLLVVFWASKRSWIGRVGLGAVWAGFVLHTAAITLRWIESYRLPGNIGRAPMTNLYESVVFFAWTIILIFLGIDFKYRKRVIGVFVVPMALLAMCWAQFRGNAAIEPLLPALQSNWLTYHVVTCFLGYAGFAVAFAVSVMYLVRSGADDKGKEETSLFPSAEVLDDLNYRAIMIGFPFLTLGIVTGAAWANYAWGTYWSWDPKETWSLIVWFIYAAFLHARLTRGWTGRRAAWLSIFGFAATLFCYLGVNLLPMIQSLHSYAG